MAPLVTTAARAQSQPTIKVADSSIRYGQAAVVKGSAGAENAGRQIGLEFGSSRGWRVIKTVVADSSGAYTFHTRLRHNGRLRVSVGDEAASRSTAGGSAPIARVAARSASQRVVVAARLRATHRQLDVTSENPAVVRGTLRPGGAGRTVRLEIRRDGRWRIVDRDVTDRRARYSLKYRSQSSGTRFARVVFAGDAANARAVKRVGKVRSYRAALASRYDMYGGALGCGGTLGYDSMVVAHKTLPCGTKVRIRYRGRTANAVVRDRGPYVGGREFDLAGAVARKLGFNGVGTIWVTKA